MNLPLYHSWALSRSGLGYFKRCFFKQVYELEIGWRSILREGCYPIKERDKQKREAISNLYYLKDIALGIFESRKAELKGDGKDGKWFSPLCLYKQASYESILNAHRLKLMECPQRRGRYPLYV